MKASFAAAVALYALIAMATFAIASPVGVPLDWRFFTGLALSGLLAAKAKVSPSADPIDNAPPAVPSLDHGLPPSGD
jgi:hypothetical protein